MTITNEEKSRLAKIVSLTEHLYEQGFLKWASSGKALDPEKNDGQVRAEPDKSVIKDVVLAEMVRLALSDYKSEYESLGVNGEQTVRDFVEHGEAVALKDSPQRDVFAELTRLRGENDRLMNLLSMIRESTERMMLREYSSHEEHIKDINDAVRGVLSGTPYDAPPVSAWAFHGPPSIEEFCQKLYEAVRFCTSEISVRAVLDYWAEELYPVNQALSEVLKTAEVVVQEGTIALGHSGGDLDVAITNAWDPEAFEQE